MLHRLVNIDGLSEEVAWELVTPLFRQRSTILIGGMMYVAFGLIGAESSHDYLYLLGVVHAVVIMVWRMRQADQFASRDPSDQPSAWAVKALTSAWALGIGWGFWSMMAAIEKEPRLVGILFGIQAAFVTGAAVVNSSVPVIAQGQVLLASIPMSIACLLAGNAFSYCYGLIVLVQMLAGMTLVRSLHQAKLRTLSNEVQARELSAKLAVANEELELVNQHLKQQVATDPLTGLLNRRAFDLAAAREWRSAMRERRLLTVVMIDVDHFKAYNDHYGHLAGDMALRHIATELAAVLQRPGDILARYGGEEFIAVLPSTNQEGALTVGDRVLERLGERALPHAFSPLGRITVSVGMCVTTVTPPRSLAMLIRAADQALYDAKRAGRNRIAIRDLDQVPSQTSLGAEEPTDELFVFAPGRSVGG